MHLFHLLLFRDANSIPAILRRRRHQETMDKRKGQSLPPLLPPFEPKKSEPSFAKLSKLQIR